MANIELPKDAEGREIPLDVEFLYSAIGEQVKPCSFTFRRYDGFCWEMHLAGAPNLVYDPESFYLTPPDSWEKLLADLKRGASRVHHPECAYFGRDENDCDQCEAVCSFACKKIAFGDIESRIRKLMGEDQ